MIPTWELRAAFARRLSAMYGAEVPAYTTLVEVTARINEEVIRGGGDTGRLGGIERVTAERHGAVRVGTARELRQAAQVFAALGMHPVGFYDLREAAASVPVVSTAFRPISGGELERNPFRVFTSMLTTADRRFFDRDLEARLESFLGRRELFPRELLELAGRAERDEGLEKSSAERFLALAVAAFELSPEPVDHGWYGELERISSVAADIGGVASTHVNHLTPRVLDIDELYRRMGEHGITMIDAIQGPPRWDGPDVLLRQTSFRALAEPRRFRAADGRVVEGALRVRFGEVEARGIALTRAGRALYDELIGEPAEVWAGRFPRTERQLALDGLAYFRYEARGDRPRDGRRPPGDLAGLLDGGWVAARPIVYEDFLPISAAGIFQSNLTGQGTRDTSASGTYYDRHTLSEVLGRPVHDPFELYAAQRDGSLRQAREAIGLPRDTM
ncbi:2-oxoadipate dioxygenase/decarboxylase [Streptomyces katsurahamanus]|uniref:2-oxoadipate dioxygenase/decarboxylase n=1 Tax=Streptomyces katsurahamanus TaxID=2577098 RepID=A0ABW9NRX0_9ACTN|nr:VOC family protein [Streptomyces katsurahamanus]MQS35909.1 VOC family protein [Streptomyces katsurahamanus]